MSYFSKRRAARDAASRPPGGRPFDGEASTDHDQGSNPNYGSQEDYTALNYRVPSSELDLKVIEGEEKPTVSLSAPSSQSMPVAYQQVAVRPWSRRRADNDISPRTASNTSSRSTGNKAATDEEIPPIETQDHYIASSASTPVLKRKTRKRSGEIGELDQDSSSSRAFGATDDLMAVSSPSSSAFGVPSHSPLSSSFSSTSTQSSTPTRRDRHRSVDMEGIGHGAEDPSSLSHSFHSHRSFGQQQQQHQVRSIGGTTARWSTTIGGGSANLNLSSGSLDSYVVEGNQGQDLQAESEGVVDLATWNRPNSWQSRGSTAMGGGIQPGLSSIVPSFSTTGAVFDANKSPRLYNGSTSLSDLPPNSSRSDSASTAFSTQFRVNKVPSASSRRRSVGARAKYRSFSYSSEDRSTTTTTFSDTVSNQSPHYAYGGGAGTGANSANANGPGRSRYRGFSYSSEAMLTSTPLETPLTKRISAPNSPIATSNAQASSSPSSLAGTHRLHLNGGSSAAYTSPLETHNFGPGPVTFSWTYQLRSPPAKRKRRFSTGAIDEGSQRSSGGTGGSNGNDFDQSEPNHRIHPSAPSAYAPSAGHDALGGNQAPIARRAYVPHQGSPGSFPAFMDSSQAFSSVSVPLPSHLNAQNYSTHLHPTSQEVDSSTSDGLHEWAPTQPSHLTPAGLRHSQLYSSGHQYRFAEAPSQTLHQSTLISTSDRSRSSSPFVPPQSRTPSLGMHIDSMTLDTSATSPAPRWTGSQPRDISLRFASALEHGSRPKEGPYANTGAENSSPESTESLWQSPIPHKTRRRGGGSLLNPDATTSSSIPFSDDSSVSSFGDFATNSAAELDSIDAIYHQSTSSAATTSSSLSSGLGFSGSSLGSIAISGPIPMHAGSSSDAHHMGMAAQHVPTSSQNVMDADPAFNAKPASATARFLSGRRYKLRSTSTEANASSSADLLPEVSEEQRAKRRRRSEEPHSTDLPRKGSARGGTTTQVSSSPSTSGGPSAVAGKEDGTHSSSLHPHQHHSLRSPGRSAITSLSSSSPANGSSPSSSTSSANSTPGSVDPSRSRRASQRKSTPSSSAFTTSPRALLPPLEAPTSTVVSMAPSKRWDLNDMGLRHILLNRPDRFNSSSDEGDYIDRTSIETESADSDAPYGADVDDDEDDEDPTAHLFLLPMPSFQAQSTTSPRGKDGAAGLPIAVNFESSMRNRHSIQALPEMGWTHKSQPRRMDPSSMEPMNEDNPFTRRRTEAIIAKSEDPRSADHATMDSNMDEEDLDERNQYRRQTSGKRVYRHKLTLSDNGPEKTRLKIFTRYIPQDTWDSGGDSRTTSARLAYVSDSATIQDRERPREWNDPDYATDASSEDPDQVHEVDEEDTSQIGENHPEDTSQVSETAPEDGPSFAVHMDSHTMQSSTSNPSLASQGPYIRQTAPVMRSTIHLVQTYQAIQQLIQTADLEEDAARSKSSSAPYYYPKQGEIIGDGRYRVVGYLGRGSFGCVVKALVLSESQQLANRADSSATTPKGGPEDPFSDLHQTVGGSTSTGGHGSQFPFPPLNLPKSQPQRPSQRSARSTASSQDGSSSMGDEGSEMDEDEELEQYVAIKISRKGASFLQQGKREVSMLERIHNYQSKQENHDLDLFVRALDTFFLDGHLCIVLELLADSLFDLVKYSWDVRPERPGLSLRMVRKMTHQLLCALITLRNMKIIHCDLKPENIALTQPNKPRLKVLDFGSSCSLSDSYLNQFPYIQSRYYRAPEILLGTGYSCSIDMWSLGCVVAELYLGRPLFEGSNSVEQIYCIIDILGMPSDNVLRNAVYLSKFFQKVGVDEQGRSILGPVRKTNLLPKTTIKELVESKNESNTPLHLKYFTDLLVRMLKWDPQQRITPLEAVNHNFILYGPKSNGD